jgi:2-oxoglutarate ferredoxin oxidoreductase subunit alpha
VMSFEELERGKDFARYMDVDGDGIAYRTYPGTHPKRGAFFTRGSSKDQRARYTEEGAAYVENMERLLRKFASAKSYLPRPEIRRCGHATPHGVIYFGSSSAAMTESVDQLAKAGVAVDSLRIRAFPFHDEIADFIAEHDHVYVVEQNRDAQMKALLTIELSIDPARLTSILHFAGTPLTARFVTHAILDSATQSRIERAAE